MAMRKPPTHTFRVRPKTMKVEKSSRGEQKYDSNSIRSLADPLGKKIQLFVSIVGKSFIMTKFAPLVTECAIVCTHSDPIRIRGIVVGVIGLGKYHTSVGVVSFPPRLGLKLCFPGGQSNECQTCWETNQTCLTWHEDLTLYSHVCSLVWFLKKLGILTDQGRLCRSFRC